MTAPDEPVALWYWTTYGPDVMVCDNESDAANIAVAMDDSDTASSPLGAQWSDGRIVGCREWAAYLLAEAKQEAERRARMANPPPTRPTRTVVCPFYPDQSCRIDASEPSWVGAGEVDPS